MPVDMTSIVLVVGAIVAVAIVGKILAFPIKLICKIALNGAMGAIVLFALNSAGANFDFAIAINPVTAVVAGVLGVPGVLLLIFLQMMI